MEDVQTRRDFLHVLGIGGLIVYGSIAPALAQSEKAIDVQIVDRAAYDKVIASHKGKVVVVDCWATWCAHCIASFSKTVEMSKSYADKGVVVVSLCFDNLEKGKVPEKVKRFLTSQGATFENLLSSQSISADGADAFEIPDGDLPHFKIYGQDGKLFNAIKSGGEKIRHEMVEANVRNAIRVGQK